MAGHDDLLKDKKGFLSHGVRDELLIRIDERLGSMQDKIAEITTQIDSPDGSARCQLHHQAIEDLKDSRKWFKRSVLGLLLGFILKLGWDGLLK